MKRLSTEEENKIIKDCINELPTELDEWYSLRGDKMALDGKFTLPELKAFVKAMGLISAKREGTLVSEDLKPFALFSGQHYESKPGFYDYDQSFETLEEAESRGKFCTPRIGPHPNDPLDNSYWYQVVFLPTKTIVAGYGAE